jgi:regulatory protein spx
LLSEKGIGFTARELAEEPLSRDEIMRLSNGDPASLIDSRKPSFRKLGVGDKALSADEAIDLMTREPSIIRRPIYEIDGEIVFGSDKDRVAELIG